MIKNYPAPHDRYFRTSMANLKVAQEFFKQHLPEKIQQTIDFDSLEYEDKIFVNERLKKQESDMLYSANFNDKKGYLYLLIEHESTVEKMMPWRLLQYIIDIMREHLKHTGTQELPTVYPLIFFTGEKPYCASTDLFDLFGAQKELAKEFLFGPYQLVDITKLEDKQLETHIWPGLMTRIMKHIRDEDLLGMMDTLVKHMKLIAKLGGKDYAYATIEYCFESGNIQDENKFIKLIKTELLEEMGENIMGFMSLAQQYMEKGRLAGIAEGVAEGKLEGITEGKLEGIIEGKLEGIAEGETRGKMQVLREITLKLLQQGTPIDQIVQLTGLSVQEIEKIKR